MPMFEVHSLSKNQKENHISMNCPKSLSSRFSVPAGSGERPLRVLHIGNIANNAYYNSKFLRQAGVEADVLCYDDYWVMSSPEWEEADFDGVPVNQYFPDWWALGLKDYRRPRWFVQGPFELCIHYLLAKQGGRMREADRRWDELTHARRLLCSPSYRRLFNMVNFLKRFAPISFTKKLKHPLTEPSAIHNHGIFEEDSSHQEYLDRCQMLIDEFSRRFPERPDRLTLEDLLPYEPRVKLFKELFKYYDLVQGYSVDPLYPMLAGFKPYVGFEHGTLRDYSDVDWSWSYKGPFYDSAIGRLTALSYALADHVFITNADCIYSVQRLHLTSFEPIAHPLDEKNGFFPTDEHRDHIRSRLGVHLVFFCPIRHDWIDKGTDKYIRALPELRRILSGDFKVCFTPWGKEVEKSRRLISDQGCNDLVEWVGPFGRVQFARWLSAADVIFDQVVYPSFSGITPRALACGVPVIASYDPEVMAWMVPEPAPVLPAQSVEEIVKQTVRAINPDFRAGYRTRAREWIEHHHSSKRVVKQMLDVYRSLVEDKHSPLGR